MPAFSLRSLAVGRMVVRPGHQPWSAGGVGGHANLYNVPIALDSSIIAGARMPVPPVTRGEVMCVGVYKWPGRCGQSVIVRGRAFGAVLRPTPWCAQVPSRLFRTGLPCPASPACGSFDDIGSRAFLLLRRWSDVFARTSEHPDALDASGRFGDRVELGGACCASVAAAEISAIS